MNDNTKIDNWDLYDPNWKDTFDYYMNLHTALMNNGEEDAGEKLGMLNHYELGFKEAHIQQFKNASEYANFMIDFLKPKAENHKLVWMGFDTTQLKTREEANTLYSHISEFLDSQIKEKYYGLPVSDKMGIFNPEDTKSQYAYFTRLGTETVVTIEKQDKKMNICLTQLKSNCGTSVMNGIETLAQSIYQQSLINQNINLNDVQWYLDFPTDVTPSSEKFIQVAMNYKEGRFKDTNFTDLETVPSSIKKARFNAAKDDMDLSDEEQMSLGFSRPLLTALILH